jgi:SAM-dependent methyltransferase
MLDRMLGFLAAKAGLNPLELYVNSNRGRLIDKWQHYLEIYHRHFAAFRGRSPVVLEIGVSQGGSLQMWKRYFGRGVRIIGVDLDARCRELGEESVEIVIGDQTDRAFHAELRRRFPHIDIVIDDGGHGMQQQIVTFEELFPHVQPNGVYVCEDLHSSYLAGFGGGLRRDGTFIERAKRLIDSLHGWYRMLPGADAGLEVDSFTRSAFALHFYDSMLVIEKRPISSPKRVTSGQRSFLPDT